MRPMHQRQIGSLQGLWSTFAEVPGVAALIAPNGLTAPGKVDLNGDQRAVIRTIDLMNLPPSGRRVIGDVAHECTRLVGRELEQRVERLVRWSCRIEMRATAIDPDMVVVIAIRANGVKDAGVSKHALLPLTALRLRLFARRSQAGVILVLL